MDASRHRVVTQREFARQASSFEKAGSLFGDDSILRWIADNVPVPDGARILDVAGGTGQTGRYLARSDSSVVVVDVTEEMLQAGLRSVLEQRRDDVTFVRGDATQLPFPDGQFDVVISRFALHHMQRPAVAVGEMARVCRPGGTITIIDLVNGGAGHDELERLRDPSHTRALSERELRDVVTANASVPDRFSEREHTMLVEPWLEQSATNERDCRRIREALAADADGPVPSGLRAARDDTGRLTITQRWVLIGSSKPQQPANADASRPGVSTTT